MRERGTPSPSRELGDAGADLRVSPQPIQSSGVQGLISERETPARPEKWGTEADER